MNLIQPNDPKLQSLINLSLETTFKYVEAELKVLDAIDVYPVVNKYISQLPHRIKTFIKYQIENNETYKDFKGIYITKVVERLRNLGSTCDPGRGSIYEDIGKKLDEIASEIESSL